MSIDVAQLAPLAIIVPFVGAALSLVLFHRNRLQRLVAIGSLVVSLAVEMLVLATSWDAPPTSVNLGGWEAPFGIVLIVDQLSAVMLVVSTIVSLAVLIYATGQGVADGDSAGPISIFHPTYLILVAGVSNAFLAGDLFNLYVGFEIFLVASYVLMTMGGTTQRIRAGVTYVVVSIISSVLFLIAIAMVYAATGTVNMADLCLKLADLPVGTQMQLHLMLLVAFGIKAAVFPLSFWLPDSYPTASAPVTAVFAGLLTKVGVYSIIRTETLLFPGEQINGLLMWVSLLTMVVGILGALAQIDVKRLLSFTLVSHIGYMVFGIAVGTAAGFAAVVYYVGHHIIIQTSLFLVAGLIERRGGSTNSDRLGGMARLAPVLAVLYMIPALNLGGIPPFSGFLGKIGLFQAGVDNATWQTYVVISGAVLTSLLTLIALMRVWNRVFLRTTDDADFPDPVLLAPSREGHWGAGAVQTLTRDEGGRQTVSLLPRLMVWPTAVLVVIGVALTVFAGPLFAVADNAAENLVNPGAYVEAVLGPEGAPSGPVEQAAGDGDSDGREVAP
ncbi:Na+/H+ antiporter subunit D [Kocuria soli]|uniref:Na+/H+ antiporter subunit D n=1 Tax=Kocuria soli TaxID=2485125 RepID=A0A3N3ZW75_9MICC|nr:Na+/H+ antiporter subunit D [Kocuria soli]ROZ65633.1 Na+/H+ antiporter subunit D [Kocuria soli]